MKHDLPGLDSLKVFESAARHLSFSLAAQELCITKGAVSYQVRKLESSLDCALFRRSVRQVYLTDAGQRLLRTTQRVFAQLDETLSRIRPDQAQHDVSIGATTYVALRWLSPRISGFSERHPDVSILLQHAVNTDEFNIRNVDFAIRWCRLDSVVSANVALQMPMPLFPVCSPQLLRRVGIESGARGLDPEALAASPMAATPLLSEDRALDLWQAWYGARAPALANPRRIIADANVRTQAAIDGQGWTLADEMMQSELDSGLLVAPFAHRLEGYGYVIQSSPGRYVSRSAIELRDWLVANA